MEEIGFAERRTGERSGLVLINAVQGPCRPAGSRVPDDVLAPLRAAFDSATGR